jgi:hypothetical protein
MKKVSKVFFFSPFGLGTKVEKIFEILLWEQVFKKHKK